MVRTSRANQSREPAPQQTSTSNRQLRHLETAQPCRFASGGGGEHETPKKGRGPGLGAPVAGGMGASQYLGFLQRPGPTSSGCRIGASPAAARARPSAAGGSGNETKRHTPYIARARASTPPQGRVGAGAPYISEMSYIISPRPVPCWYRRLESRLLSPTGHAQRTAARPRTDGPSAGTDVRFC